MSEGKFWISIWSIVGAVIATLILSITFSVAYDKYAMARALRENSGRNVLEISCAMGHETADTCLLRAIK